MASAVEHRQSANLTVASSAKDTTSDEDIVEKDIDGVPLRDHKKIDLKSILGHAPEVEEEEESASESQDQQSSEEVLFLPGVHDDGDEYEYGYSDDDEGSHDDETGDVKAKRPLQRRSSLKAISPPAIENIDIHKKAVRFADALGLGLAAVRDLINADEPPEIPHSALKDLRIRKKRSKLGDQFHLSLGFIQPSSETDFITRLHDQKVILENCVCSDRDLTVSGVVRVANVSYNKRVDIRSTTDSWLTFKTTNTVYVPNSNDGATDRFMFIIHLPEGFVQKSPESSRLEFAVEYRVNEQSFWDNNRGKNYSVNCVRSNPLHNVQLDHESSGSEGEFVI